MSKAIPMLHLHIRASAGDARQQVGRQSLNVNVFECEMLAKTISPIAVVLQGTKD